MYDVHADPENVLAFVRTQAEAIKQHLPAEVLLDDLIQDGSIGMIEAAERYDPTRKAKFRTFAKVRIRGAMLDGLRKADPVSRSARRRAKNGGDAPPGTMQLLTGSEWEDGFRRGGAVDARLLVPGDQCRVDDNEEIGAMIRMLPDKRLQKLIEFYFLKNLTLEEIRKRLRINKSRASQLIAQALGILRAMYPAPPRRIGRGGPRFTGLCAIRRRRFL